FSHLADDGPGAEDDAWPVADEPGVKSQVTPDVTPDVDPVGAPTDDGPLPARPGSGLTPGLSGRSADPSGESHIFFETELPLNAEQMLGDTLALDSASAPRPSGPLDVASVLDAAPDADKQERGLEAQTDSQLTDIGIPCFDPPPAVAESASQEDDRQNGPHEQAHAGHPGLEPATARAGAAAAA